MKQQFNINNVIEAYKPNISELAKVLFPAAKYPAMALSRVIKGEANLDTVQVQVLADYLGLLVSDLFTLDTWKAKYENSSLTFVRGIYKVRLNYQGAFLVLYKNDELIKKDLLNTSSMALTDFINYINELIKKY